VHERPTVILLLDVGARALTATVRDPELRLRVRVDDVAGSGGHVLVSVPGRLDRSTAFRGGWPQALRQVAAAMDRYGLRPRVVAHRITHGSDRLTGTRWVDDELLVQLRTRARRGPCCLAQQLDVLTTARRLWPLADDVLCSLETEHRSKPSRGTAAPSPAGECTEAVPASVDRARATAEVVDTVVRRDAAVGAQQDGCSVATVTSGHPRHTASSISAAIGIRAAGQAWVSARPSGVAAAMRFAPAGVATGECRTVGALIGCDPSSPRAHPQGGSLQPRGHLGSCRSSLRPDLPDASGRATEQHAVRGLPVPAMTVDEERSMDRSVRALTPEGAFVRALALADVIHGLTSSATGLCP
jgi:hypothetical protein